MNRVILSRSPAAKDPKIAAYMASVEQYLTGYYPPDSVSQLVAQGRSLN